MLTDFEKSQSGKILGSYQENDIEKSKFKKVIHVHGKTCDYDRVQLVGSEKAPMSSKHHGMNTMFPDKKKQKEYDDHLHSLVEHGGKYYKLEDKKHSSGGRTSFGSGSHKGATEYKLHPYEEAYKKKLHEDRETTSESPDVSDLKTRIFDDNYHGTFQSQKTAAYHLLDKREKTPEEELHKEANDKIGKEMKKDEDSKKKSVEETQRELQKDYWDVQTKNIEKEFKSFDYKNGTIKELASLVNLKIRRMAIIKPDMKVSYINSKGEKKDGTWVQLRDWLLTKAEEPTANKTKLSFKDIKVDFGENPYDTDKK